MLRSNVQLIAAIAQSVVGTFVDPTANVMPISNLSRNYNPITVANPEFTGTIDRQGDEIIGFSPTLTFDINLRGPGGTTVPAAGAFLPGIFLVNAKMAELRTATAIPAAPEALSAGTTTAFTMGAGAAATAGLYKGMLVELPTPLGAARPKSFTPIQDYTAAKVATIMETLSGAASGNYQMPKQLGYHSTLSATEPLPLSIRDYYDGVAVDLVDCIVTNIQFVLQTSERDSGFIPMLRVTVKGRYSAKNDTATPTIPSLGTTPKIRDGKFWINRQALGASQFNITRAIESAAGPNPNMPDGSDYDQTMGITSTVELTMQAYRKAVFDQLAIAGGQAYLPFFAMWGSATGQTVCVSCPSVRMSFAAPSANGSGLMESPTLLIDVFDRSVNLVFPFWP